MHFTNKPLEILEELEGKMIRVMLLPVSLGVVVALLTGITTLVVVAFVLFGAVFLLCTGISVAARHHRMLHYAVDQLYHAAVDLAGRSGDRFGEFHTHDGIAIFASRHGPEGRVTIEIVGSASQHSFYLIVFPDVSDVETRLECRRKIPHFRRFLEEVTIAASKQNHHHLAQWISAR